MLIACTVCDQPIVGSYPQGSLCLICNAPLYGCQACADRFRAKARTELAANGALSIAIVVRHRPRCASPAAAARAP
jgi:hypothetical protein